MTIFNNIWVLIVITLVVLFTAYVLVRAFVIHSFFWSEVDQVKQSIKRTDLSLSWLEREHCRCAYVESGKPYPYRLIALRELIQQEKEETHPFDRHMALSSDMYGQVKYLIRTFNFPMAIVMWWKHLTHRNLALHFRSGDELSPTDMEVVGAKYYALATQPIIGWLFTEKAAKPLRDALTKTLAMRVAGKGDEYSHALHISIFMSKLFVLTKDDEYRFALKSGRLTDEHLKRDRNQMSRIAKNFRFHTPEEMLEYCEDH